MWEASYCLTEIKAAETENAHVAALFWYRNLLEYSINYVNTSPTLFQGFLLEALKYAGKLKKERDKLAVAEWGSEISRKLTKGNLTDIINQEIAKLQRGGKDAAT